MNFMPAQQLDRPSPQRAVGVLGLQFGRSAGGPTRVEKLYQQGCLKARLPRATAASACEAVTMNIGGGVAGGDLLAISLAVGPAAAVTLASAAAERVYRALPDAPSRITTRITLAPGAMLHHLPQETILFDGFALDRSLEIDLAEDASYLGVESLVFGRQAMGEAIHAGYLRDRISLRRNGALIYQDMTRLHGDIAAQLCSPAIAQGNIAMASIIHAAPDAATRLPALRAALSGHHAGASLLQDGIIVIRILARTAISLRNCVAAALGVCRDGRALPRVWQI